MSSLYCADWSRVIIGMHLGVQTAVLRERYADQLQFGLLTYMRFFREAFPRRRHGVELWRSYFVKGG
jgi:hypothetical protein